MSRCMCCSSKYECSCTDIQQSVVDLANAEQVVDMQKLEIELLKEENARLREALVKIERDAWETMKEEIENIARKALERGE